MDLLLTIYKRLLRFRLRPFPKDPDRQADTKETIYAWEKYKGKIRGRAAFYFVLGSIFTLIWATPNFSISGGLFNKIIEVYDVFGFFGRYIKDYLPIPRGSGPTIVKAIVFLALYWLAVQGIESRDSLSNIGHLDMLAKGNRRKRDRFLPWTSSISFYAKECPTASLISRCKTCTDRLYCDQLLGEDYNRARRVWGKIIGELDKDVLYSLLLRTNRCRSIALTERVVSGLGVIAVCGYLLARLYEAINPSLTVQPNYMVLGIIFTVPCVLVVIRYFHPVGPGSTGGGWHLFQQEVAKVFEGESFNRAIKSFLCMKDRRANQSILPVFISPQRETSEKHLEREYRVSQTLIAQMNSLVERKLAFFIDPDINNSKKAETYIGSSLAFLLSFYYAMRLDEAVFRACVFLPSEDESALIPWKWETTSGASFMNFPPSDDKGAEKLAERFDIGGKSLVAMAWGSQKFLCTDEPHMFYPKQREHLKSIAAMPLLCDDRLINLAKKAGLIIRNPIGVLCLDTNKKIFKASSYLKHRMYMKPFSVRVTYELLRSAITFWDNKGEIADGTEKPFVTPSTVS